MELYPNSTMYSIDTGKSRKTEAISTIVVDDSENIVRLLTDFLELSGIRVLGKAYNGKEAVELYKKKRPDVVLLDIMMPQYDGFYALERIMQIDNNAKILIVTADLREETLNRLRAINDIEIIYKPFDFNNVIVAINRLLESHVHVVAYQGANYTLRTRL